MDTNIITVLIQVPLVGAFIWFTLRLTREHREDSQSRDELRRQDSQRRDELWREFLTAEREERRQVMGEIRSSVDELTKAVSKLNGGK